MKKKLFLPLGICLIAFMSGCAEAGKTSGQINAALEEAAQEERTVLTYGYISVNSMVDIDNGIRERIVDFNKSQDQYTIEMVKYGDGSRQDGLNALNADISAGKGPDIIELDTALAGELGRKGILEDLYPYMDGESSIGKEDFVENVLTGFEEDGSLYALPSSFVIYSMLASPGHVAGETVSFRELLGDFQTYAGGQEVFNNPSRSYFISNSVLPSIPELIDQKSCHFDLPEFREMLEELEQFDEFWLTADDHMDAYTRLGDGELFFLDDGPIYSFDQYGFLCGLSGEELLLVGQPTLHGRPPGLGTNAPCLAINHASAHKEAAWEFICTTLDTRYLVQKYEKKGVLGFPITRAAFEWSAQKEMEKEKYDQSDENLVGEIILTSESGRTMSFPCYRFTGEQLDNLKSCIAGIHPVETDSGVEEIVYEELTNYWNGVSDMDKAISNIQNRVQLFLDEQN